MDDSDRARIAAQAKADQRNAAATEYAEDRSRKLTEMGAEGRRADYLPCDRTIIEMLNAELEAGSKRCWHDPLRGDLMFWNPRQRVLLCGDCNDAEALRLAGSYATDSRCDVCGAGQALMRAQGQRRWSMRSLVLGSRVHPDGYAVAAAMITYLACPVCRGES